MDKQLLIHPEKFLTVLSHEEINILCNNRHSELYEMFRRCALAVLNSGIEIDDSQFLLKQFHNFQINILQQDRGIKLEILNAPDHAFVDGQIIKGIQELIFSVLRDVIYVNDKLNRDTGHFDLSSSMGITDTVFRILRNAQILLPHRKPDLVVCWGGHAIGREEYLYSKKVGYALGLRNLNICTGCGPGAMKGPMKGATIGHAKQRVHDGRYIGITEPGIITAESPNPIVNELVIMPDIEKRLEAFIRIAHAIIIFPGGVGTTEEILYLLGILLHPKNKNLPFPLILTGPKSSESYFLKLHHFIEQILGFEAQQRYKIIINDPESVAKEVLQGMEDVKKYRLLKKDAFYFNWQIYIEEDFQKPFIPHHENMAQLVLSKNLPAHELASNLRKAFSGIVAGNVKEQYIQLIQELGPYEIQGDKRIMRPVNELLKFFVKQKRMKLPGNTYHPCYQIKKGA